MNAVLYWVQKTYTSFGNGRSPVWTVAWFCIGFLPVMVWLFIFKTAGSIPVEWRPDIHVKLTPMLDDVFFNPQNVSSWLLLMFLLLFTFLTVRLIHGSPCVPAGSIDTLKDDMEMQWTTERISLDGETLLGNDEDEEQQQQTQTPICFRNGPLHHSSLLNFSIWSLLALISCSWPLLNLLYYISVKFQNKYLDITAFISYVICHLAIPIATSIYLYLVHPSGDMMRFSCNLGIQNILAVLTHLFIPTSPPWFIHMNGINAHADYGTLGYAAGLTRVDAAFGTHLSTDGFHKSPIVFGACPSVHSAMAVCCLLWLACSRKVTSTASVLRKVQIVARVIGWVYLIVQWWATMYLDHHWRVDLFFGMWYSIITFLMLEYFWPIDLSNLSFGQRLFAENRSCFLSKLFYDNE